MKFNMQFDSPEEILRRRGLGKGEKAQKWLDSEVLRLSAPYLPHVDGELERSGINGTKVGSGLVVYNAPKARFLYYGEGMVGERSRSAWAKRGERKVLNGKPLEYQRFNPQAGKQWITRMVRDKRQALVKGLADVIGGKSK